MRSLVNSLPRLAVIFIAPHAQPKISVTGRYHPALTTGRHDLVLTERPGSDVTDAAYHTTAVPGAMRLRAVLDYLQAVRIRERHDRIHVTWHACQMHTDDCAGARCQNMADRPCRDILRITVHVGKHGTCACSNYTRRRRYKRARSDDYIVTGADTVSL